ncbi:hypothetical protein [Pseudomonas sp. TH10]|uniref:hypothetical protein n=1 Tax=Pseudomonas sp. TH10 TaxID=2796376 RepID=UPI001913FA97|nr:hypothetical protein [Pseudomonas sp. TH10]MBK5519646.1 hypothetical protein [Pseudomonas sp. TH10]
MVWQVASGVGKLNGHYRLGVLLHLASKFEELSAHGFLLHLLGSIVFMQAVFVDQQRM